MQFSNVSILGLSHVDAPHRVDSQTIEQALKPTFDRLNMSLGILEHVAGIKARRYWDEGMQPSQIAALAGREVLLKTGLDPNQLGMIINTSVCRDFIEPSTACLVHKALELPATCMNFDLGSACLGFINGMDMISALIESGVIRYGLVVDGETCRDVIETTIERLNRPETTEQDVREQFATLTLGSGGVAMILCHRDLAPNHPQYKGGVQLSATEHAHLCQGQPTYMKTQTKALLMEGVKLANQVWKQTHSQLGWSAEELDHLILHQVSQVHTQTLGQTLGLPLDKVHVIFDEFGNIGPAAVPITLSKKAQEGVFQTGQRIALMAIGSGLNCQMTEIVWGEGV